MKNFGCHSCALWLVVLIGFAPFVSASEHEVYAYARAPAMGLPTLSPDGRWLSYVEERDGAQDVVLRALGRDTKVRALTLDAARDRARWCGWESSAYLLCGTAVPRHAAHRAFEETNLYVIDATNGKHRILNRALRDPLRDRVIDLSPDVPGTVLIEHDEAGSGYPAVAELDVRSGHVRMLQRSREPIIRWFSDVHHQLRLGVGYERGRSSVWIRTGTTDEWRLLAAYAAGDAQAFGPLAISPSGTSILGLTAHDGRFALGELSLANPPQRSILHGDPLYDVTGPLVPQPPVNELEGVRYTRAAEATHYFDPTAASLQRFVDQELPGTVNVRLQRTLDENLELISSSSPADPPSLYLLDREQLSVRLLGHQYPELETAAMATMRATKYRARDGQVIPAFLTMPTNAPAPTPAIVLPHGGPETRDSLRFDPLVQFLAAEGYAVLQMNFRGSSGYGIAFAAVGAGQWGGVIHNDITDGARWLVEEGIADPASICIVGSSFGGYAAMLGAARESPWYACAASFAGISDLLALARANDRSQFSHVWRERLGGDDRALWNSSPLARAQFVDTPILLMHGSLDAVVPVRQSRRLANALEKAGRSVTYVERIDCDHDMTVEPCRLAWFRELRAFLRQAVRDP